jgi:hypothetical protein
MSSYQYQDPKVDTLNAGMRVEKNDHKNSFFTSPKKGPALIDHSWHRAMYFQKFCG